MKKNILLLFLACSLGFYNLNAMMTGYGEGEAEFSENDTNFDSESESSDETGGTDGAGGAIASGVADGSTETTENPTDDTGAPTVDVIDSKSAIESGGALDGLQEALDDPDSGVVEVEVEDDKEETLLGDNSSKATSSDGFKEFDLGPNSSEPATTNVESLLNENGNIDPEELKEMFQEKFTEATTVEGKSMWAPLLEFLQSIADFFGPENLSSMMETITKAFKSAISSVSGALEQLEVEMQNAGDDIKAAMDSAGIAIKNAFSETIGSSNPDWVGYFDTPQEL